MMVVWFDVEIKGPRLAKNLKIVQMLGQGFQPCLKNLGP